MSSIRPATEADLPAVARLFGGAFVEDAMLRWPLPTDATVEDVTMNFAIVLDAYSSLDAVWVTEDLGARPCGFRPQLPQRFLEIEGPTRELIHPLTDDGGARYDVFWDWLGGHVPDDPCWFLDIVAVDAAARGRGYGGRLIEHGLDTRARARACPPSSRRASRRTWRLYERFGFRVIEQADAPAGGPTIWFMRADPPSRA